MPHSVCISPGFKTGDYTVTRYAQGSYTDGIWSAGGTSTFSVPASVQPLTGYELQSLGEGFHAENTKKMYCVTQLKTEQDTTHGADEVSIDGEDWVVHSAKKAEGFGGTHYKVTLKRKVHDS